MFELHRDRWLRAGNWQSVTFTISLVSSLSAMDLDMFRRLGFPSVLFWLDLPVLDFVKIQGSESHDFGGVEHSFVSY